MLRYCFCFMFWCFGQCGMWNLRILVPLQEIRPTHPCIGRQSLNHRTAREVPLSKSEIFISTLLCLVTQSCLTLCNPVDCSPPGPSIHGILQARILEWVPMPSSRGSSQPRDGTCVSCSSCFSRCILSHCATWETHVHPGGIIIFFDLQKKELRLRLKAWHLFWYPGFAHYFLCDHRQVA